MKSTGSCSAIISLKAEYSFEPDSLISLRGSILRKALAKRPFYNIAVSIPYSCWSVIMIPFINNVFSQLISGTRRKTHNH